MCLPLQRWLTYFWIRLLFTQNWGFFPPHPLLKVLHEKLLLPGIIPRCNPKRARWFGEKQTPLKSQLRLSHPVLPALLALGLRMAGFVCPHTIYESRDRLLPNSVASPPPHVGLFQKSTLNSEFSKSPSTCLQQLWNPPSTISSAAWKGNYRLALSAKPIGYFVTQHLAPQQYLK